MNSSKHKNLATLTKDKPNYLSMAADQPNGLPVTITKGGLPNRRFIEISRLATLSPKCFLIYAQVKRV